MHDGSLKSGTADLTDGANELKDGIQELFEGTVELKDGTAELLDGCKDLIDGCKELKDGTAEMLSETDGMEQKIQDKVDEMIDGITGGESTVVSFVSDKNSDVSAVQFVIQTEAIEIPEIPNNTDAEPVKLNFWQTLLKLFGLYQEN